MLKFGAGEGVSHKGHEDPLLTGRLKKKTHFRIRGKFAELHTHHEH